MVGDWLSAYVIIAGNPPSHAGSGSKQTHVVSSKSMDTSCKHWYISINIQFLSIKIIKATYDNIAFMISALDSFKLSNLDNYSFICDPPGLLSGPEPPGAV